jgi:hypothetical protein
LKQLEVEYKNYNLCKLVQIGGFNKNEKRYITVSAEAHVVAIGACHSIGLKFLKRVTKNMDVNFITWEHIDPPVKGKPHKKINLGKYGSTGAPMHGIKQHPDADDLREAGKIRQ